MQSESHSPVRVGLLGCGTVGGALARIIDADADRIAARTGVRLEIAGIAVRNLSADRDVSLPEEVFTREPQALVGSPDVDIIVETIGGIEPARQLVIDSLKSGKPVITANKEMVANVGQELFEAASAGGVDLFFEAAVAGGIPLIRALRDSLAGERINRVMGIVNGTTNFILTKMTEEGAEYSDVPRHKVSDLPKPTQQLMWKEAMPLRKQQYWRLSPSVQRSLLETCTRKA